MERITGGNMLEELKKKVCQANKDLVKHGLVMFTFGNVSAIDRENNIVAIKPSGVKYDQLSPSDIILVDLKGNIVEGNLKPSSDTPTHLELYKHFHDIGGIVHTHSTYATVFSQIKKEISCLGTTHADHFYGEVPVTRELKKNEIEGDYETNTGKVIVEHFKKNSINPAHMPACLVASHGPFSWGKTPEAAVYNAAVLEEVARMALMGLLLDDKTKHISQSLLNKHYWRKHGKEAYYGQTGEEYAK